MEQHQPMDLYWDKKGFEGWCYFHIHDFSFPFLFGTLHICVSRIVNLPKTTNFFGTNLDHQKTFRRAITLIWRKVLHCEHLYPWWRAWLYFIHCRTAGHFSREKRTRIRTCEVEHIHARNKKNTTSCSFFNFRHETQPKKISFKTLTLVSLPSKSNVGWKRIYFLKPAQLFQGTPTTLQGFPRLEISLVLSFSAKWKVQKPKMPYCKSSQFFPKFPCLRIKKRFYFFLDHLCIFSSTLTDQAGGKIRQNPTKEMSFSDRGFPFPPRDCRTAMVGAGSCFYNWNCVVWNWHVAPWTSTTITMCLGGGTWDLWRLGHL